MHMTRAIQYAIEGLIRRTLTSCGLTHLNERLGEYAQVRPPLSILYRDPEGLRNKAELLGLPGQKEY